MLDTMLLILKLCNWIWKNTKFLDGIRDLAPTLLESKGWRTGESTCLPPIQCVPGSNPGVDAICELRLLLVLFFSLRGFPPGTLVFPSPQRPTFSHVLSPNHIYLFIYLLIYSRSEIDQNIDMD